ncbi:MAG TPA: tetratricopeptide repeat protein [Thermoanaerobaculia bacterium]|nr:tetratricopeptide repeat protein [Thermoanaerobaculia bacterium]
MPPQAQTGAAVVAAIRSIWLERRDAELVLQRPKGSARLTFRKGELYLPSNHAAAPRLKALLEHVNRSSSEHARRVDDALGTLVDRLVEAVMATDLVDWRIEAAMNREIELVGPLPTAALVMRGTVRNLDEKQLLERLRGEASLVEAHGDASLLARLPGLDKSDAFLHSRAEKPVTVEALLKQAPAPRLNALRALGRLEAIDMLRVVDPSRSEQPAELDEEERMAAMVQRLEQKVKSWLDARPVRLDANAHYEIVADRVTRLSSLNHYEILDLEIHSDEREVHRAYDRIGRLVHPVHAKRLGVSAPALSLVFEQATVAYLTLMDAERRAGYNYSAGIEGAASLSPEERGRRRVKAARKAHERARQLAKKEEIHFAIELARQAVAMDPQPKYLALLGRLLARNPQWFTESIDTYHRAIELAPDDLDLRLEMAERYEERGEDERVRAICREVLQQQPSNARAQGLLGQIGDERAEAKPASGGLMERIRRWMGGRGAS